MLKEAQVFILTAFAIIGKSHQAVAPQQCIFYAKDASIREFPYFAALSGCGAAILSKKWLVTAAHCVEDPTQYPGNRVWVGGESISNSKQLRFKRVVMHPGYKTKKKIPINDIALIELERNLKFSHKVKPVKLGTSVGTHLMFVGKGKDETGQLSKVIKKLEIRRLTTQQCVSKIPWYIQNIIRPYIEELETVTICAKRIEDIPGMCMGDSGSPLTYNNQLVGLASYVGNEDCHETRLNFFTNVLTYVPWIRSVTGLK